MLNTFTMIRSDKLLETIAHAKNELGFTLLLDITAIDNLDKAHPASTRFELVYILRDYYLQSSCFR